MLTMCHVQCIMSITTQNKQENAHISLFLYKETKDEWSEVKPFNGHQVECQG